MCCANTVRQYVHVYLYVDTNMNRNMHIYIHSNIHSKIYTYVRTCMFTYRCIIAHTYIHIRWFYKYVHSSGCLAVMNEWMSDEQSEWVNKWTNELTNERMNECMNDWLNTLLRLKLVALCSEKSDELKMMQRDRSIAVLAKGWAMNVRVILKQTQGSRLLWAPAFETFKTLSTDPI